MSVNNKFGPSTRNLYLNKSRELCARRLLLDRAKRIHANWKLRCRTILRRQARFPRAHMHVPLILSRRARSERSNGDGRENGSRETQECTGTSVPINHLREKLAGHSTLAGKRGPLAMRAGERAGARRDIPCIIITARRLSGRDFLSVPDWNTGWRAGVTSGGFLRHVPPASRAARRAETHARKGETDLRVGINSRG